MKTLKTLTAGLVAIVLVSGLSPTGTLAQGAPAVVADKDTYYNGETATVTLTGLTECAGQQVELGFIQEQVFPENPAPVGDASPDVTVGTDGSAVVNIIMTTPKFPFGHTGPVVRGSCVPGGEMLGTPRVTVLDATGPGQPPEPPNTGTGAAIADERPGFGPIAAIGGLVAIVAAGMLAVGARLANRRG